LLAKQLAHHHRGLARAGGADDETDVPILLPIATQGSCVLKGG